MEDNTPLRSLLKREGKESINDSHVLMAQQNAKLKIRSTAKNRLSMSIKATTCNIEDESSNGSVPQ